MARIAIVAGATAGSKRRAATHYGPREIEDKLGSQYAGSQGVKKLAFSFSFDDLPESGLDAAIPRLAANARILSATLRVLDPIVGTTPTVTIGLQEEDGTEIDNDGIDVAIAEAALDAVGESVLCDGALVNNLAGIGAAVGQVVVTTGGTVTAGKFALEIEYEELHDRA